MDLTRRGVLTASGAAIAATLAGCMGNGDDPEDVVEEFTEAIEDGDREAANDLIHEDSEVGELTEQEMEIIEDAEIEYTDIELVEEDDDTAEVEATMSPAGDEWEEAVTYELRKEDDEWRLYDEHED